MTRCDRVRASRAGGEAAVGPSLIPQAHGGALLSGGKPGNPGHNQHTARQRAQELRGQLIGAQRRSGLWRLNHQNGHGPLGGGGLGGG